MSIPHSARLIALLGLLSCRHNEAAQFTLRHGEISDVESCHLKMLNAAYQKDPPFVGLKYVCGLPASDLDGWPKGDPKWLSHPTPPLAFTLSVGECLKLDGKSYCVESVKPGEAVFRAR